MPTRMTSIKHGAPFISASQLQRMKPDLIPTAFLARLTRQLFVVLCRVVDSLNVAGEFIAELGGEGGWFGDCGYGLG